MKKWLKIVLIIISVLVVLLIADIASIYMRNRPIFAVTDTCDCNNKVYRGLLYDTYSCNNSKTPEIKFKWTKHACPVPTNKDAIKFASEYTSLTEDNIFVYKTADEIINILENGTGIVYLGFPECPWCVKYVTYLNEVGKSLDLEKIHYFNVLNDRKDNTEDYKKIVSLIEEHLQYDDEGNKRIYVPSVIAVNKGEIIGFDDETAWDTGGFEKPDDYWTKEKVDNLKTKLTTMINKVNIKSCTSCNID